MTKLQHKCNANGNAYLQHVQRKYAKRGERKEREGPPVGADSRQETAANECTDKNRGPEASIEYLLAGGEVPERIDERVLPQ